MEEYEIQLITEHLRELVDQTICSSEFLSVFRASSILSKEDFQNIQAKEILKGNTAAASLFYDIIKTRKDSFLVLRKALHETNQSGIIALLQLQDDNKMKPENDRRFTSAPSDVVAFISSKLKCVLYLGSTNKEFTKEKILTNIPYAEEISSRQLLSDKLDLKLYPNLLVVDLDVSHDSIQFQKLANVSECKIVIIMQYENLIHMKETVESSESIEFGEDSFTWSCLNSTIQGLIKHRVEAKFQGIRFDECFETLPQQHLLTLINEKEGSLLPFILPDEPPIYIPRTLVTRNTISSSIFDGTTKDIWLFEGLDQVQLEIQARNSPTDSCTNQLRQNMLTCSFMTVNRMTDFNQICFKTSKTVHLLKHKNGVLTWKQTRGVLDEILRSVDTKSGVQVAECNFLDVTDNVNRQSDALVCISDAPGMGKSYLLFSLGRKLRQTYPDRRVFLVFCSDLIENANDHVEKISDRVTLGKIITATITKNKLAQYFLATSLKLCFGNIELLLDGFDEIQADKIEFAKEMLHQINVNYPNIRIWLTTRPHFLMDIEQSFCTLGYNILPFTETNQVNFFERFWLESAKAQNVDLDIDRLKTVAETCLSEVKEKINRDSGDIAGIPLQCMLIAECFEEYAINFSNSEEWLDLNDRPEFNVGSIADLFKLMIETKLSNYFQKVKNTDITFKQKVLDMHYYLSLLLIFPNDEEHFRDRLFHCDVDHDCVIAVGLMQKRSCDFVPSFLHRTFAEFFVAKFLHHELHDSMLSLDFKNLFFKSVLFNKNTVINIPHTAEISTHAFTNYTVCYFLDSALIKDIYTTDNSHSTVYADGNIHKIFNFSNKLAIISEKFDDFYKYPMLIKTISYSCAMANFHGILKFLYHAKGFNIYNNHFSIDKGFLAMVIYICDLDFIKFSVECFQHLHKAPIKSLRIITDYSVLTLLHIAFVRGKFSIAMELLKSCEFENDFEQKNKDYSNLIHVCVKHTMFDSSEELSEKQKILQYMANKHSWTFLSEENNIKPFMCEQVHINHLKILIRSEADFFLTDINKRTVLHKVALRKSSDDLSALLLHASNVLKEDAKIKTLLELKNIFGNTILHTTIASCVPKVSTLILFKKLNADFNAKNVQGKTALCSAICQETKMENILFFLSSFADCSFSSQNYLELYLDCFTNGNMSAAALIYFLLVYRKYLSMSYADGATRGSVIKFNNRISEKILLLSEGVFVKEQNMTSTVQDDFFYHITSKIKLDKSYSLSALALRMLSDNEFSCELEFFKKEVGISLRNITNIRTLELSCTDMENIIIIERKSLAVQLYNFKWENANSFVKLLKHLAKDIGFSLGYLDFIDSDYQENNSDHDIFKWLLNQDLPEDVLKALIDAFLSTKQSKTSHCSKMLISFLHPIDKICSKSSTNSFYETKLPFHNMSALRFLERNASRKKLGLSVADYNILRKAGLEAATRCTKHWVLDSHISAYFFDEELFCDKFKNLGSHNLDIVTSMQNLTLEQCAKICFDDFPNGLKQVSENIASTLCDNKSNSPTTTLTGRLLKWIIKTGAEVNCVDEENNTPLHIAMTSTTMSTPEIVSLLLNAGANPNARNLRGQTPLTLGCLGLTVANLETFQVLRSYHAVCDSDVASHCLYWVIHYNLTESDFQHTVTSLVDCGANIYHIISENSQTLLELAFKMQGVRRSTFLEKSFYNRQFTREYISIKPLLVSKTRNESNFESLKSDFLNFACKFKRCSKLLLEQELNQSNYIWDNGFSLLDIESLLEFTSLATCNDVVLIMAFLIKKKYLTGLEFVFEYFSKKFAGNLIEETLQCDARNKIDIISFSVSIGNLECMNYLVDKLQFKNILDTERCIELQRKCLHLENAPKFIKYFNIIEPNLIIDDLGYILAYKNLNPNAFFYIAKLLDGIEQLSFTNSNISNINENGSNIFHLIPQLISSHQYHNLVQGLADHGLLKYLEVCCQKFGNTSLHEAINTLDIRDETVDVLVEHGFDLNIQNKSGETILCAAVLAQKPFSLVKHLISKGSDVLNNTWSSTKWSLFDLILDEYITSEDMLVELLACLQQNNLLHTLNFTNKNGYVILHHIFQKHLITENVISMLLNDDVNLDILGAFNNTILHIAARKHTSASCLVKLFEASKNVYLQNQTGKTFLHYVSLIYTSEELELIASLLVSRKMTKLFNTRDNRGCTAIIYAASNPKSLTFFMNELVNIKKIDWNIRDNKDLTFLHHAAKSGCISLLTNETLKKVFCCGIDISSRDMFGRTFAHYCTDSNNSFDYMTSYLLKANYQDVIFIQDIEGVDALAYALSKSSVLPKTLQALKEMFIDLSSKRSGLNQTYLHYAAKHQNVECIEELIKIGVDASQCDIYKQSFLHDLAFYGSADIFDKMVCFCVEQNLKDVIYLTGKDNLSCLHVAIKRKNILPKTIIYIAQNGIDLNSLNKGVPCLECFAMGNCNLDAVKALSDCNVNFSHITTVPFLIWNGFREQYKGDLAKAEKHAASMFEDLVAYLFQSNKMHVLSVLDGNGDSLISAAIERFDISESTLQIFKKCEVGLNSTDKNGCTPLMYAVRFKRSVCFIKTCISMGANLNASDINGHTFAHYLPKCYSAHDYHEIVSYLIEIGEGDVFRFSCLKDNCTPIHTAVLNLEILPETLLLLTGQPNTTGLTNNSNISLKGLLLSGSFKKTDNNLNKKYVDLNVADINGHTVLHYAIMGKRSISLIKLLVTLGANPLTTNKHDHNLAHFAASFSNFEVLRYFVEQKCNINHPDDDGDNVLQCSVLGNKSDIREMVAYLIKIGVNKRHKNKVGKTAYQCAREKNITDDDILDLLK